MSVTNNPLRQAILLVSLIIVAGITTMMTSATVAAQPETDIQWTGGGANGPTITQDIQIEPTGNQDTISFGADAGRSLQIQNVDTGEVITLTPTGSDYEVEEFELNFNDFVNFFGDNEYKKADDPIITLSTDQDDTVFNYPVKIDGDPTGFFDETFYQYNVQLIASDGSVVSETDETQIRGAGYNVSYEYNGSALAVKRDPGVQPDWHVILEQEQETIATADNNLGDEYFIFYTEDTKFSPNKTFRPQIYPDETQTNSRHAIINLFAVSGFDGAEDDQNMEIVDGPVGVDTNGGSDNMDSEEPGGAETDDSIPGFGIGGSVVALGAGGYMLKRRLTDDFD